MAGISRGTNSSGRKIRSKGSKDGSQTTGGAAIEEGATFETVPSGRTYIRIDALLSAPRGYLLAIASLAILATAWLDWWTGEQVTLGVLYILPIILLSATLSRGSIVAAALICALLRLLFNPHPTAQGLAMNGSFALLSYLVIGLSTARLARNRREILGQLDEIRRHERARKEAEEQLRLLAESSPAAIFTLDSAARIVSANRATGELLGIPESLPLAGRSIKDSLPVLADALKFDTGGDALRTTVQMQGKRLDGSPFLAQACFSTYRADDESLRLAAIAFDSTEEMREREEQNQVQMRESSRIVAGAVAHEIRNICSAMAVAYANLESAARWKEDPDFRALGNLLNGLGRFAGVQLQGNDESRNTCADLQDVLNQLRILIGPSWEDEGGAIEWPHPNSPILAAADPFTLLQAFLNIANNALIAVSHSGEKRLTVVVEVRGRVVWTSLADSGPGVAEPDSLFQPFRSGFGNIGIGLYVSRALLRRHGGDIRYEPQDAGSRFIVEVPLYGF